MQMNVFEGKSSVIWSGIVLSERNWQKHKNNEWFTSDWIIEINEEVIRVMNEINWIIMDSDNEFLIW